MVDHQELATLLAEFAENLLTDYHVGDILDQLGRRVSTLLPVVGVGIMLADENGTLRFAAATSERIARIEEGQSGDPRFPRFSEAAREEGVLAVFTIPMLVGGTSIGALDLYRESPTPLADAEMAAAQVLANVASAYIVNSRNLEQSRTLVQQLQHALDSRVVIEQAKGKLSAELGGSPDEAFSLLRSYARRRRISVDAASQQIIAGELPSGQL